MVKKIAFGTNKLRDPLILSECIYEAQNVGYEFVDTSWFYGNESALGRAKVRLESKKQQLLIKIHSKVWFTQYKGGVGKAFQLALGKLHRRNFNSYGLHRPHHDLRLTLKAWEQLVKYKRMNAEQLENIGVSNFNKDIIELLYESSGVYPEYNQIELSVNNFRFDRVAYCKTKKITLEAFGVFGQINRNLQNDLLIKLAKKYGTTVHGILISFISSHGIIPVVKSEDKNHIRENFASAQIQLADEDLQALYALNTYENVYCEEFDIKLEDLTREEENESNKLKAGRKQKIPEKLNSMA